MGLRNGQSDVQHPALDRIQAIEPATDVYRPSEDQTPDMYYRHVVGVPVSPTLRAGRVLIRAEAEHAPYVETKPLHHSQRTLERYGNHIIIELTVQLNFELERDILGFGEGMTVLTPARMRGRVQARFQRGTEGYEQPPEL